MRWTPGDRSNVEDDRGRSGFGAVPIGPELMDVAPNLTGLVSPFTGVEGFDVDA